MKRYIYILSLFSSSLLLGQSNSDYLGAGHDVGVTITSSPTEEQTSGTYTFDGKGLNSPTFAAGRFLSQVTLGPTAEMIDELVSNGNNYEEWIEDQFEKPFKALTPVMEDIWEQTLQYHIDKGDDPDEVFGPFKPHFDYAWWQYVMTEDDYLRQKVAYALHEIFVISVNSDLNNYAKSLTGYYDILMGNSFGNFRDLLEDVTYSIQMGYYLSHLNNAKENPEANTSPDENYAREIMQLFSIGLFELNNDGTVKLDEAGQSISTYNQETIQEFAKVFTGLGIGVLENEEEWPYMPFFGLAAFFGKKDSRMVMYEDFHDQTEKRLLNGLILPAGQTGDQDIEGALDNIFNHPNVGPFIGNLLIKRLVKSNPSPEYIARVADAFNDNGSGVRGDMKSVIRAILLDEEARSGEAMLTQDAGRAREPMLKYTGILKSLPTYSEDGRFWNINNYWHNTTLQSVLSSPTVFNYFPSDFKPIGELNDANLTAPELKLHNTSTAINYINEIYAFLHWREAEWNDGKPRVNGTWLEQDFSPVVRVDLTKFTELAEDPELLINELDKRLTYGQLTDELRAIIVPALNETYWSWSESWRIHRVKSAIYYILISPDYNIMK